MMKVLLSVLFFAFTLLASPSQEAKIRSEISHQYRHTYPTMQIHAVTIKPVSSLYKRLSDYAVTDVSLTRDDLRRNHGNVMVTFTHNGKKRKLYFKYSVDADISLYTAAVPLQRGRAITPETVVRKTIPFTTLYQRPVDEEGLYRYVAKRNIKVDAILSLDKLKERTDIQRNDKVRALIHDGGVTLSFEATALRDGNVGDIIPIRKDYKRRFKARVLSNTEVEVLQ